MAMPEYVWTILLCVAIAFCVMQYFWSLVERWWTGDRSGSRYPHLSANRATIGGGGASNNTAAGGPQVVPLTPSRLDLIKRRAKLSTMIPFVTFLQAGPEQPLKKDTGAVTASAPGGSPPVIATAPTYEESDDDEEEMDEEQGRNDENGDDSGDRSKHQLEGQLPEQPCYCQENAEDENIELNIIDHPDNNVDACCCPICLEPFRHREKVRLIEKCRHIFHSECILDWLVRHDECPCCRHKVWNSPQAETSSTNSAAVLPSAITLVEDVASGGGIEMVVEQQEEDDDDDSLPGSGGSGPPPIAFQV